jgi:hypothetical protein
MLSCNLKLVRERYVSRRDASSIALWLSSVAAHVCRDVGVVGLLASNSRLEYFIFFAVLQAVCQSYCWVYISQVLQNVKSLCVVEPGLPQFDGVSLGE